MQVTWHAVSVSNTSILNVKPAATSKLLLWLNPIIIQSSHAIGGHVGAARAVEFTAIISKLAKFLL